MLRRLVTSTARAPLRRNMGTLRLTTKDQAVNVALMSHVIRKRNEVVLVEGWPSPNGYRGQHKLTFTSEEDAKAWFDREWAGFRVVYALSHRFCAHPDDQSDV